MSGFDEALEICRQAESSAGRGRRFEELIRDALAVHPGEYGPARFKSLWLWQDWRGRHERSHTGDIGIDIVGEQTGGGLCAIQCKLYDTAKVTPSDVDKFLAASDGHEWTSRIFIATGDYTRQAEQKLNGARNIEILSADRLRGWEIDWARLAADRNAPADFSAVKYTPRPDQQQAVDAIVAGLRLSPADDGDDDDPPDTPAGPTGSDANGDDEDPPGSTAGPMGTDGNGEGEDPPGVRGRVVMPCGTGKSVVALWAAEELAGLGRRVLYLVPSISLMDQTMREWARQRSLHHRYLGACSDVKVGKRSDEDILISELAMPVTTDAQKLASELKPEAPEALRAVFSTYQSLPKVIEAQRKHGCPPFDLVICDEAHRTTGVESDDSSGLFTLVHDEDKLRAKRRLYMTATQRIYTDAAKARHSKRDVDIFSMDDADTYGPLLYDMKFGEAIENGLLSDYEVLVVGVSEQHYGELFGPLGRNGVEVQTKAGGTHILDYEDAVKLLGCWDAFADPYTRGPGEDRAVGEVAANGDPCRRVIAFSNTVRSSKRAAESWEQITDKQRAAMAERASTDGHRRLLELDADHVDGAMNAWQRTQKLEWLRQAGPATSPHGTGRAADSPPNDSIPPQVRVLSNARCLTEGVDVPALDAVVFLAPRQSVVDIVQAVGRVMRTAPGKQVGYVVLPVLIPEGELLDADSVLASSDFKQVFRVLRALRSHDERLDVQVNSLSQARDLPLKIIDRSERPWVDDEQRSQDEWDQLQLALTEKMRHAVASAIVENVGDRQYWPSWGRRAARVYKDARTHLDEAAAGDERVKAALEGFAKAMSSTAIPSFTETEAREMLCQHIVTIPVFDAFFAESRFAERNPISRHVNTVLAALERYGVSFEQITKRLEDAYRRIGDTFVRSAQTTTERLDVLRQVYDGFLKAAVPDAVARLGIVYTPIQIVDFMLRSVDAVCRQEFNRGLTDENVTVLDPFTGTGTFLARLLTIDDAEGNPLIADGDVARKYHSELAASEIVMLPYYLAALQIEEAAAARGAFAGGHYVPFEGIVLADTFESKTDAMRSMRQRYEQQTLTGGGQIPGNAGRLDRFEDTPIKVIVSNPPWSAGQKSTSDDNPRADYDHVADRVRETYGAKHKEITGTSGGKSAGNLYVQAFRWATDRLAPPDGKPGEEGWVVAFVHPNSLVNGTSLAGMRAALRDEFTSVHVINLRGDAYKAGKEFKLEGDKIFGGGSRNGVAITVAVRRPDRESRPGQVRYAQVPDGLALAAKFAWLNELGDATSSALAEIPLTARHDWVNIGDGSFENLHPVCDTDHSNSEVAVDDHALGVTTACDDYVYSFSREELEQRVRRLIDAYERARQNVHPPPAGARQATDDRAELARRVERATVNDNLAEIKWTGRLKTSLKRNDRIEFDPARVREVLYRPFTKLWLYEDDLILSSVKTVSAMFPRDTESERERERERDDSPPHPVQQDHLRADRNPITSQPLRRRSKPTLPSTPRPAILITSPSNMTIPGLLAATCLPDLHTMAGGQSTRTLPPRR